MMVTSELTYIKLSEVSLLPYNPRKIKKADFDRLIDSIKINGFWKHRPLAIEVQDGKNFVLCGNQRVKAAKKLKLKEVPAVFYSELTDDERVDLITRDNISNGEWDQTVLDTDPHFQDLDFEFMGLILPGTDDDQPKKRRARRNRRLRPIQKDLVRIQMKKISKMSLHRNRRCWMMFFSLLTISSRSLLC